MRYLTKHIKKNGKWTEKKIPYTETQDDVIREAEKEMKKQCQMFQNGLIGLAELHYKLSQQMKTLKKNDIPPDTNGWFLGRNTWNHFKKITDI